MDAFLTAATSLGLAAVEHDGPDRGVDVELALPDGSLLFIQLKSVATVSTEHVSAWARRSSQKLGGAAAIVLVADRITATARERLSREGVNWLDLRGHLRLVGPGLIIDADVPPLLLKPHAEKQGITGQVGVELSALLLLEPDRRFGVRAAAEVLSRAPSSISEALAALRSAQLVDEQNRPDVPALFWELAEHWKPMSRDVASVPEPGRARDNAALRLGLDDVESTTGWALTDTVAALAHGAPISTRADYPPDFYVPDQSVLRRAVQLLGTATTSSTRAGRVRVAPVPMVCNRRIDGTSWSNEVWPLVNPLFAALDLAQDPGRGREILDGWTPGKPWHRVW